MAMQDCGEHEKILCPYPDCSRLIEKCNFKLHLIWCRKNYRGVYERCQYTTIHYVPIPELYMHQQTCEYRASFEKIRRELAEVSSSSNSVSTKRKAKWRRQSKAEAHPTEISRRELMISDISSVNFSGQIHWMDDDHEIMTESPTLESAVEVDELKLEKLENMENGRKNSFSDSLLDQMSMADSIEEYTTGRGCVSDRKDSMFCSDEDYFSSSAVTPPTCQSPSIIGMEFSENKCSSGSDSGQYLDAEAWSDSNLSVASGVLSRADNRLQNSYSGEKGQPCSTGTTLISSVPSNSESKEAHKDSVSKAPVKRPRGRGRGRLRVQKDILRPGGSTAEHLRIT